MRSTMAARKLNKSEWEPALDALSHELESDEAEIEIASATLGLQTQTEWVPLIGVTYDPEDDLVEVALEGLDHLIHHPREIYFDTVGDDLLSVLVVDSEGQK